MRLVDLTGMKFGKLTVVSRTVENRCGRVAWDCVCECGNTTVVLGCNLRKNDPNTTSCGCYLAEARLTGGKKNVRSDSGMAYAMRMYRYNAKYQDRAFTLSKEEFVRITQSNCHYCGTPPTRTVLSQNGRSPYTYNGIDRVDNNIGYELRNCVPCCTACNIAKGWRSYADFMDWLIRAGAYQKSIEIATYAVGA